MTSLPCPSSDRWKLLLDDRLPEAEQAVLSKHLEGCTACQQALETLSAGRETWNEAARLAQERPEADDGLKRAMEKARAIGQSAETILNHGALGDLPAGFLSPPDDPAHLGKIAHYEVFNVVGSGAFGIVLRAFDQKLHRVVAIKVMSPLLASSASARKRFVREGRAAAAVCHEHVVTIHAVDEEQGLPYLVMQYVGGVSLQDRLDRTGPLQVHEILRIGMQTAAGLAAAHAQGLVHRDVKPSNILLENSVERVKLTDFGLARAVDDASLTQSGVIAGTPQYMAPEQARGDTIDHRADLFSLGSVLYALAAGRPPFRGNSTLGVIRRVCDEQPRPLRDINIDIPDWLDAIILKLLAKSPADRYQSAREVAETFEARLAQLQRPPRATSHTGNESVPNHPPVPGAAGAVPLSSSTTNVTRQDVPSDPAGRRPIAAYVAAASLIVLAIIWLVSANPKYFGFYEWRFDTIRDMSRTMLTLFAILFGLIVVSHRFRTGTWRGSLLDLGSTALAREPALAAGPANSPGTSPPQSKRPWQPWQIVLLVLLIPAGLLFSLVICAGFVWVLLPSTLLFREVEPHGYPYAQHGGEGPDDTSFLTEPTAPDRSNATVPASALLEVEQLQNEWQRTLEAVSRDDLPRSAAVEAEVKLRNAEIRLAELQHDGKQTVAVLETLVKLRKELHALNLARIEAGLEPQSAADRTALELARDQERLEAAEQNLR